MTCEHKVLAYCLMSPTKFIQYDTVGRWLICTSLFRKLDPTNGSFITQCWPLQFPSSAEVNARETLVVVGD